MQTPLVYGVVHALEANAPTVNQSAGTGEVGYTRCNVHHSVPTGRGSGWKLHNADKRGSGCECITHT